MNHTAEHHRQNGLHAAKQGQWEAARRAFEHATRAAPRDALAWMNLARAQARSHQLPAAIASTRRAIALAPQSPLGYLMCSEYQLQSSDAQAAAQTLMDAPDHVPRDHDWYAGLGVALFQAQRLSEAVTAHLDALALKIDAPLVHYRLGLIFRDLGLASEAAECLRTATQLDDEHVRTLALSHLVLAARQSCDWANLDTDTADLLALIDDVRPGAYAHLLAPFVLLAVPATTAQQWRIGALRTDGLTRGTTPLPPPPPRRPGRIRVGYLSSDFLHHATAMLLTELLECHDRNRFEVFCYSHGHDDGSASRQRIIAAPEHFIQVRGMQADAVARRMRADGIDIAIDLKGHTRDSRFEILAYRPAPVQVAFLGYPATSGAPFLDYFIGDATSTPLTHAAHFSEKLAQMPHSYQPNDRLRPCPPTPTRAELGLPEHAVVLSCFNQTYKLSPQMVDLWAQILHGAPTAVLWLLEWTHSARTNLTREFAARGIAAERLLWAPAEHLARHVARMGAADLFLDTWPCNAHTTASEAMWAGVPVLTCPGETFASRVGASLVAACELPPHLIATSPAEYVKTAIQLANAPAELAALKHHLRSRHTTLPLFDTPRYARDFEALLTRMFTRRQRGEAPDHLPAAASTPKAEPDFADSANAGLQAVAAPC